MTTVEIYKMRLTGQIDRFPNGYWTDKDNVRKIVKYLLEEMLGYSKQEIADNFSIKFIMKYKLWGAMQYFRGSPYELLNFVYPGRYKEWELKNVPMATWNEQTTVEAMRWLFEEKLCWDRKDIIAKYSKHIFKENGMYGLIHYFDNSPYKALCAAYPGEYLPWELKNVPLSTWDDTSCKEAVRWLFEEKLCWSEEEIRMYATKRIFNENRLGGLLRSYNDSVFKLLAIAYPGKFSQQELQHRKYNK